MTNRSFLIIAAALITTAAATPALAMYNPQMGRFMQRDPLGTAIAPSAPRVGMAGPTAAGGYIARDSRPTQPQPGLQYADGMSLYQYVGSNPVMYRDPSGLLKIRVGYRGLGPANTAGDTWHETLIGGPVGSKMYNWSEGPASLKWMLSKIDVNGDKQIDATEIQDLDLGLHGFSQGGVGAIDASKRLNETFWKVEGYKLCQPVPVKILVSIDPASFAVFIPSPKKNVQKAVNYYQKRGGEALWYNLDAAGNPVGGPNKFGNWFSAMIVGNKVGGATNHRVDTRPGHRDGIFGANTRIHAQDINHDTIPWYVAPEAVADLQ